MEKVAELCVKYNVWLVSDEIHCDILREGIAFTSINTVIPEYTKLIICTAPSKTFNLAGNNLALIFINDAAVRNKWTQKYHYNPSPLSIVATLAAYTQCNNWLQELKIYLDKNFELLDAKIKSALPNSVFFLPEATYLAWIDISYYLRRLGIQDKDVNQFFVEKAGVVIDSTTQFIDNSSGHIRINVACPTAILEKGIARIIAALK